MRELDFSELCQFTEKQWYATETADTHRFTLFGGSRGPGKSYWLRWGLVRLLLRWAHEGLTGVDVMLGCEDYPSLKDRQISKIADEFPPWLGSLQETKQKGLGFHLWPKYGGGSILLRNLDDASKYQSAEFAAIGIDELTKNTERTFHILRGSMRWPGIDRAPFMAATNPEANWVRDYWIEGKLPEEMAHLLDEFAFVPGLPDDNPHLPESYWDELNSLPGALRQAWRYGDWYAAVEGLVFDSFGDENVTEREPDPERPFEIAIDDGYIDPRATLFIQKQGSHILVFDELYQTKALEEQTIRDILRTSYDTAVRLRPDDNLEWPDSDDLEAITRKLAEQDVPIPELAAVSHEAVALRDRLRRANIPARNWLIRKAGGGTSTRIEAIKLTRSLICDGNEHRTILVHKRCRNLLDEIRAGYKYPEGKRGLNEKPEDGNDHACEALESWCWLRIKAGA
jgi:hypothetical protein